MRRINCRSRVGHLAALGIGERCNYGGPVGGRRRLGAAGAWFVALAAMIWFAGMGSEQVTIGKAQPSSWRSPARPTWTTKIRT